MRATGSVLTLALLLLAGMPYLASPAAAASAVAYEFEPGESAVALRTDPSTGRCFRLALNATVPSERESGMAAVYLFDGAGALLYAEVHAATVGVGLGPPAVHVGVTLPDGTRLVERHRGYPAAPGEWRFLIDRTVCLSQAAWRTWVFAAVTSEGVSEARAVFAMVDGSLAVRQTVKGAAQGFAATDFEGAVADTRYFVAPGATAATREVAVAGGLLASFFSFDAASVLHVEGTGIPSDRTAARECVTNACFPLAGDPSSFIALAGAQGDYTFRAVAAGAGVSDRPGAATFLLVADIRMPFAG